MTDDNRLRIMLVIEGLALMAMDEPDADMAIIRDIYKFAHLGTGLCGNPHEDWAAALETAEKALQAAGIMNVAKICKRLPAGRGLQSSPHE